MWKITVVCMKFKAISLFMNGDTKSCIPSTLNIDLTYTVTHTQLIYHGLNHGLFLFFSGLVIDM